MANLILRCVIVCVCLFGLIRASAIPMWEYLNKDEKMAYLYNMFATQVEEVCQGPDSQKCKEDLVQYGLKNLHTMSEDHLDAMDPFQRDANSLIWKSMMDGHKMMSKMTFTTTVKPERDIYADFSDSNYLGSASSRRETVLNLNGNFITNKPNYNNYLNNNRGTTKQYGGPMIVKVRPNGQSIEETTRHYGPMIIKLHPDGRPVEEIKSIPQDDDEHHYAIVKMKVPAPTESAISSFDYKIKPTSNYILNNYNRANPSTFGFYRPNRR